MQQNRIVPLECARGVASLIVMFHHFLLAFYPALKASVWNGGLKGTPFYVLVNGTGAVTFFFVLSGFVLTVAFYRRASFEILAASALKRLPRLMVPAGASILLGLFVLEFAGGQYQVASAYSGSQWLRDFGNAGLPPNFTPSVLDAIRQSLMVFLSPNHAYYNSNLWTMVNEFYGSLLVFGIVFLFSFQRFRSHRAMTVLHGVLAVTFIDLNHAFVPFVAGSFIAYWITNRRVDFQASTGLTWVLLVGAVVGFANERWIANTMASIFVILILLGNHAVAKPLSGRAGALVGRLSFPLYLVHTLVILSVTSFVYAWLMGSGSSALVACSLALMVTLLASCGACVPFILLDAYWVSWLNKRVRSLIKPVADACARYRTGDSSRQGA